MGSALTSTPSLQAFRRATVRASCQHNPRGSLGWQRRASPPPPGLGDIGIVRIPALGSRLQTLHVGFRRWSGMAGGESRFPPGRAAVAPLAPPQIGNTSTVTIADLQPRRCVVRCRHPVGCIVRCRHPADRVPHIQAPS
jgi:hypothetical protein